MIYFFCFVISMILFFWITTYAKFVDINMIMLVIVIAVGNGGFFALANAHNLYEAILANSICYVIGIFAPAIVFHIVCSICKIHLPKWISLLSYAVQMVLYLTVFTVGKSTIFYKSVYYHAGTPAYLTKTYGPMHTIYLICMIFYTLMSMIVGLISLERKTIVSRSNVTIIIFLNLLAVGIYIVERLTHFKIKLMPVTYVASLFILMVPLLKIYIFSVYNKGKYLYFLIAGKPTSKRSS